MKTMFIVNPLASRGKCKERWDGFEHEFQTSSVASYETAYTSRAGEAETIAKQAIQAGFERIVAVGGDGTVNEVVNGTFSSDAAIGILPFGTGNDLARTLSIPNTNESLIRMLRDSDEALLNVADVNGRRFVIAAGIGFDGIVAKFINDHYVLKRLGTLGYAAAAFGIMTSFVPGEIQVKIDGREMRLEKTWMVAIGNCRYYGGGLMICPDASYDDDLLDICIVSNLSKPRFIQLFPMVYSGKHVDKDKYVTMLRGKDIQIDCPGYMIGHADGELIESSSLRIRLSERKIRFIKPVG